MQRAGKKSDPGEIKFSSTLHYLKPDLPLDFSLTGANICLFFLSQFEFCPPPLATQRFLSDRDGIREETGELRFPSRPLIAHI